MMAIPAGRNYIFDQAKKAVLKQTKGLYPAPLKIIEVVKNGIENPSTGYEMEAKVYIHSQRNEFIQLLKLILV
jgi:hypothetical protein